MTEYLQCEFCGWMNELESFWRHKGDLDDTHYINCKKCRRFLSINNQDRTSDKLWNEPTTIFECGCMIWKDGTKFYIKPCTADCRVLELAIEETKKQGSQVIYE